MPAPSRSRARGPAGPTKPGWVVVRFALAAAALGVLSFAIQGGQFGTTDLLRQRRALALERAAVDSLERHVDSLATYLRKVESDPATQERIAREEFGMVRPGEILYRFIEPDRDGRP